MRADIFKKIFKCTVGRFCCSFIVELESLFDWLMFIFRHQLRHFAISSWHFAILITLLTRYGELSTIENVLCKIIVTKKFAYASEASKI